VKECPEEERSMALEMLMRESSVEGAIEDDVELIESSEGRDGGTKKLSWE
jgi:hypothetical protein